MTVTLPSGFTLTQIGQGTTATDSNANGSTVYLSSDNASALGLEWMSNLGTSSFSSPIVAHRPTLDRALVYVGDNADLYRRMLRKFLDPNQRSVVWLLPEEKETKAAPSQGRKKK